MALPQIEWIWLVPALPLIGSVINGVLGGRAGRAITSLVGVGSVALAFLLAVYLGFAYVSQPIHALSYEWNAPFNWLEAGAFRTPIGFLLDPLSIVMMLVVTGVGLLIHIYSTGYMADDPGYNRYFAWLSLFTFAMLTLVLGNSFLVLFLGWELVGLSSYLLIGFWYNRETATNAGRKAFVVNRIGDWAFVIGVILTFVVFLPLDPAAGGSLQFVPLFRYVVMAGHSGTLPPSLDLLPIIAVLLFIGAMGKSAQLPILHVWLPDAMEGPTPVSALIHAATMVTAGVYMVARCHPFFVFSPAAMHLVAWVGVLTALYAATVATVQTDIKRVLAYSTISQLGYMFLGAGVGAFSYSIFHLVTHAFYKGLLFLGAGAVIHALHNEQDMRKMGGLHRRIPVISWMMLIGVLAISGFPFLSGFVSKDLILEADAENDLKLWILGSITAFLTAFYMTRLWLMTFLGKPHWQTSGDHAQLADDVVDVPEVPAEPQTTHDGNDGIHAPGPSMVGPIVILATLSAVGGLLYYELPGFLNPLFRDTLPEVVEHTPFASQTVLLLISTVVFLLGAGTAWVMYAANNEEPKPWMQHHRDLYRALARAWYIDDLAHLVFGVLGGQFARAAYRDVELRTIDQGGVYGIGRAIDWLARGLRRVQSGIVGDYALAMAVGAACVVVYFLLR